MPIAAAAPRLLLASGSPRRRELLLAAGYRFEVGPAPVEESVSGQLTAAELVRLNARRKVRAGALFLPRAAPPTVVLGADTLVSLDGLVLGKPRDLEEAFTMLARLVGRTHEVITGVCLLPRGEGAGPARAWVERTAVTFCALDAGGIHAYLARINPLDKAGAYAAQEHGSSIIAATAGSWSNVVGLPMESVSKNLAELGMLPGR